MNTNVFTKKKKHFSFPNCLLLIYIYYTLVFISVSKLFSYKALVWKLEGGRTSNKLTPSLKIFLQKKKNEAEEGSFLVHTGPRTSFFVLITACFLALLPVSCLIIYMKKFIHSDWLRAVRFFF